MSTTWWSNKHNMHHALTNEVGYDEDIALDPALHLWAPDPKNDIPWLRRWQHVYWPIPYSILFLYWRFDSIRYVSSCPLQRQALYIYVFVYVHGQSYSFTGASTLSSM